MGLNELNTSSNSYEFTKEEIVKAKENIKEFYDFAKSKFEEDNIEEHKAHMAILPSVNDTVFLLKALIIMKENGAKSIDELDKLEKNINKVTTTAKEIEDSNDKISELQEEANIQQDKDLEEAKILSENIKNSEKSKIIGEVLKNGNVYITEEVKNKFINYGEIMGFTSSNPISLILKTIGENYLGDGEIAPSGLLMIAEYVKYDIEKGVYGGGDNRGERLDDNLLELGKDIKAFLVIYPKILGEMFGNKLGNKLKDELNGMGMNIIEENEDGILSYYKEQDSVIKIMEMSEGNMGGFSALMSLKGLSTQEELDNYFKYMKEKKLDGSELWRIFSHELNEDAIKLKEYFDKAIV